MLVDKASGCIFQMDLPSSRGSARSLLNPLANPATCQASRLYTNKLSHRDLSHARSYSPTVGRVIFGARPEVRRKIMYFGGLVQE